MLFDPFFTISWSDSLFQFILVFSMLSYSVPTINKETVLPYWAEVVGIILSVLSALCIPVIAIKQIAANWGEGVTRKVSASDLLHDKLQLEVTPFKIKVKKSVIDMFVTWQTANESDTI